MSLRECFNRCQYLQVAKRFLRPIWIFANGRTGQDAWLYEIAKRSSEPIHTIIDVGSSSGHFLQKAAIHFPSCYYYHFEPRRDAAQDTKNISQQLKTQSTVFNIALGDFTGNSDFAVMDYSDASSLINSTKGVSTGLQISKKIQVQVDTLDNIAQKIHFGQIGLLKIDVEGFELAVLKGSLKTLDCVSNIIIEITQPRHVKGSSETLEIFSILFQSGFTIIDTYCCDFLLSKDLGVLASHSAI